LLCVQGKTPDDEQRNCPKREEFYSKNKFEKLVHLVGFIIRIYHDARSLEQQKRNKEAKQEKNKTKEKKGGMKIRSKLYVEFKWALTQVYKH